jgi:signal transduction histidine kinase
MSTSILTIWKEGKGPGMLGYKFRLVAYLSTIVLMFVHHQENNLPIGVLEITSAVILLLVPQVILYRYIKSGNNLGQAIKDIAFDFFFAGCFIGLVNLSLIPSLVFAAGTLTNYIASRGFHKLYRILYLPLGASITLGLGGFYIQFENTTLVNALSIGYAIIHYTLNSTMLYESINMVRLQNIEIKQQRIEIQEKSEELNTLNESLKELNGRLEINVKNRTQELEVKNKKLEEYTFINAHRLRAPVASILGLIQLLDYKNLTETENILKQLKKTATELDDTTKEIRAKLEAEGWLHDDTKQS